MPSAASRWPSPCTRPAGPRGLGSTSCVGAGVPTLVIQGERDTMGRPEEFPSDLDLTVVPGADHGLKVPKNGAISQADALGIIVESTLEWLVREIIG